MVSWFHQTELTTVLDLARCEEFRRRLDAHGIPYKVKGKDRSSPLQVSYNLSGCCASTSWAWPREPFQDGRADDGFGHRRHCRCR